MATNTYAEAHPLDRWTLPDGTACWMTGEDCEACGHPMATDGRSQWCTAGCEAPQK